MSTTCTTDFSNLDKFKCDNAESQLKADDKDAFLFNLTMNPQRDPDEKRIGEWTYIIDPEGKDRRKMSVVKYEKERREALDVDIQILKECHQELGLEGGGRMQRRRKRKRKRTQKRRRKKRKRRTRR
jgi:hypothetical protein